jgi:hypothetical protein
MVSARLEPLEEATSAGGPEAFYQTMDEIDTQISGPAAIAASHPSVESGFDTQTFNRQLIEQQLGSKPRRFFGEFSGLSPEFL